MCDVTGTEVTISYLGAPQLLPLAQRREALANSFGFDCTCSRCGTFTVLWYQSSWHLLGLAWTGF